jgi:hypothetical protein
MMPPTLTWQEIEAMSAKYLKRASAADADVVRLLYTLAYLYDPEIAGVYVSREYMRTVHALLDDPFQGGPS